MTRVVEAIKANGTTPISAGELSKLFGISPIDVRAFVNKARSEGVVICSCRKGYYYSEDEDEVKKTIKSLQHRISSIQRAIDGLVGRLGEVNEI